MKEKVLERLLRYVKIDTTSDSSSTTCPSTEKQFDLARVFYERKSFRKIIKIR